MRKTLWFFLFASSFSLGLAGGAVATRPIEESVPGGEAALDSVIIGDMTAEWNADAPGTAEDSDSKASGQSVEPSDAAVAGEVASIDMDPALVLTGSEKSAPHAVEEDVTDPVERLARVFAQMSPRDAAPVLSNLSDTEVRMILMRLAERTVADILANVEPERAARLSRLLISAEEVGRE